MTAPANTITVAVEPLRLFARDILHAVGCDAVEAEIVAEHLVGADLAGHPSHGVGLLPRYVQRVHEKKLRPNTCARLVSDDGGSFMAFEGDRGFGQRVAAEVTHAAIERCQSTGIVVATLRDAHHIGRVGVYGELCAAAGLVGLAFVNATDHAPLVAPYLGRTGRLSTNPLCIAIPPGHHTSPVIVDFATTAISLGKARVALESGAPLPRGAAIDRDGGETIDPAALIGGGALLPAAGHKGYALAVAIDLLVALFGGNTSAANPENHDSTINNMLLLVIDPKRLHEGGRSRAETDRFVEYLRTSPSAVPGQPVVVPGDPERAVRAALRWSGIAIPGNTWRALLETGAALGVSLAS